MPSRDPAVNVFRSDLETSWKQFRLGDGLNVVVANPSLPATPTWRFSVPRKGTSASPVVAGTTVLVPANDAKVYAIDGATGKQRWVWKTDNEVMTSPVYEGDLVIVGAGNSLNPILDPPEFTIMGTEHSHLDALHLQSGKAVWQYYLSGTGMPSPALSRGWLIHFDGAGVVKAVTADTGAFRWRRLLYSVGTMSNVLLGKGGVFYITGLWPNAVYAMRVDDGSIVWRHNFSNHFNAISDCPIARSNGSIVGMYVAPVSKNPNANAVWMKVAQQHVYALDERTGAVLWDRLLPGVRDLIPAWNESAIPLIAHGTVYDGSALSPIVTALDVRNGRIRWQLRVNGPVKGGLVDRDGTLYFGDLKGRLWAVDDATGTVRGSVQTDLSFNVGSPIILNDSLVIGSQKGQIVALPLDAIRNSKTIPGITQAPASPVPYVVAAVLAALLLLGVAAQFGHRRSPA